MDIKEFDNRILDRIKAVCLANDAEEFDKCLTPYTVFIFCEKYGISSDWLLGLSKKDLYKVDICKNCGKLFHVTDKREKYCNRKNDNGRTCKDVGYENTMDSIDKAYRKAYKTKNVFKNRNFKVPGIQFAFDEWKLRAQNAKQHLLNAEISTEEYLKVLESKIEI